METALPEDDGSGSCPPCLPPVPPELQFAHEAANAGGGGSSTAASPNPQQPSSSSAQPSPQQVQVPPSPNTTEAVAAAPATTTTAPAAATTTTTTPTQVATAAAPSTPPSPAAAAGVDTLPASETELIITARRGPLGLGLALDRFNRVCGRSGLALEDDLLAIGDEVIAVDGESLKHPEFRELKKVIAKDKQSYQLTILRRHPPAHVDAVDVASAARHNSLAAAGDAAAVGAATVTGGGIARVPAQVPIMAVLDEEAPRQPQGFDMLGLIAALLVGAIAMLVTRKLQNVSGVEVIEDSPNGEQLAYAPGVPLEM